MALDVYRLERANAERQLILLHGWSAEQHHLAAYVPLVDPDERFTAACPRAPHDLDEGDGASWYERTSTGGDPESFAEAVEKVAAFVDGEMDRTGIGPERTVIGGFSQGGFLTLSLALRSDAPRFAGVWAMCCAINDIDRIELDLSAGSGAGRPALIQYGRLDEIITPDRTTAAADSLEAAGWDVTTLGYEMAHSQTIEMMVDARTWLAAID